MYLDWENQAQDYIVIDIETDGLDAKVVWVMCWESAKTGQKGTCRGHKEIQDFFAAHRGSVFIGHNIVKFDAPVLNRLLNAGLSVGKVVDTLILSTLYNPSIRGGHSLSAWGERIGIAKIEGFEDWTRLSDEMIEYCEQDVSVTVELFKRITKVLRKIGFSELTCSIQHNITHILSKQQQNGFQFNGPKAMELFQQLRGREEELQESIYHAFPPQVQELARYKQARKKDGTYSAQYHRHVEQFKELKESPDGSYAAYGPVPFNLGSPDQRVKKLLEKGWKPGPDEVTKTGKPRPFVSGELAPSLEKFLEENDVPEIRLIAKWMTVNGRGNMVNTWLENWNEDTGCIHGSLFVADTLRFRHQKPNTANIPAVRANKQGEVLYGEDGYFTYEARDLWTARAGRVLVGTDAAGLELRMLAHYLNRPQFTEQVINGDPHQYNADLAGVERPNAKTLLYAIQYGAQGPKVARILGRSNKEGYAMRQLFLDRLGLTEVMEDAIAEQETGRVWLCDGAGVVCPSPHAALNYKLQGGGARVMALGAIFLEGHIRRDGLDSLKVGDIHDEWQYDVDPKDARQHAARSIQAIREAGEELNLNLPLDANAQEGLTWAETH